MQRIIIIAGPSGVGKTTVTDYLYKKYNIPRVITHTTRPMRTGEINGKSYYFETNDTFRKLHFFEHVKYGNYQYGSSREALEKAWRKNDLVTLIVETEGVASYLNKLGNKAYFIYLTVSDSKILKQRLIERGDDVQEIEKRINSQEYKRDLRLKPNLERFAHYIINDNLVDTKEKLDKLITSLEK